MREARSQAPWTGRRRFVRARKIPGNAGRRLKSPTIPVNVEMLYILALERVAARFTKVVGAILEPHIALFARPATRTDAGEDLEDLDEDALGLLSQTSEQARLLLKHMKHARKGASDIYEETEPVVEEASAAAARRILSHSKHEFRRLGIDIRKEPDMKWLIHGWRKDSVALITKMQSDKLDKIEKILDAGWGHRAESLERAIREVLGSSSDPTADSQIRRRARLIARDQVLTLNAKITRFRQQASGIKSYIWTTSLDERVRPEHAELEGETFSWDGEGDPEEGHPGEAINCRCVPFPLLDDEFLDEDD